MDFNQYSQPIGPTAYNPYQFSPQGQSGQTGFPGNAAFGNAIPGSQFGATQFGSTLGSAPGFTPGFAPGNGFGFQSQQTDPTFAYTLQLQQQQLLQQLQQLQQLKQLQLAQLAQQLQQAQLFQQLPQQGLGGGPFGNSSPAFGSAASFAPQAQLLPQLQQLQAQLAQQLASQGILGSPFAQFGQPFGPAIGSIFGNPALSAANPLGRNFPLTAASLPALLH